MITGATSGIGKATAFGLAKLGARVILLGRNESAGMAVERTIRREHGPTAADYVHIDLSDQREVRAAAATIAGKYSSIDVLINNAGARYDAYETGRDGHEMTFSGNHLGHFLLTCLLLERLIAAPAARIIAVSSGNHGQVPADGVWELPPDIYDRREAYARSKLANIVFSSALAERLHNTRVISNIYEPGGVSSNFARNNGLVSWGRHLLSHALSHNLVSPRTAADGLVRLAHDQSLGETSGRYVRRRHDMGALTAFHDPEAASALWNLSLKLTALDERVGGEVWAIIRP